MTLQLRKLCRELFKEISQNEIITPTDKKTVAVENIATTDKPFLTKLSKVRSAKEYSE